MDRTISLEMGACLRKQLWLAAIVGTLVLFGGQAFATNNDAGPNFVLIIADDCTYTDMEVYGGQAKTPNLKRLASEGMKFERCFQAAPMCSPTRHCLYTGLYPVKSGAWPNHTRAYDDIRSIAHYLQAAGYRTHLSGKTHIGPKQVFPFEYSKQKNNPDMEAVGSFFRECASKDTPFLLIAASNEPHSPWNKGDRSAYPEGEIKLSPIQADTSETRQVLASYFAEITYFDKQVGQILELLEKQGLDSNTFVIVLSEQGYGLPFAKWTCYEAGVRSACLVRWPGKVKPGSETRAMIEYVDVVPTILDAAGVQIQEGLDGKSFMPVLTGDAVSHKDYVYSLQTSKGINNGPEHYGIRSVRGDRYRYIRNLTPEVTFENAATNMPLFESWIKAGKDGDGLAARLVRGYRHRPQEELYDCEADPWNQKNLIDDPAIVPVLTELREKLNQWMDSQGDRGQETEELALTRMPNRRSIED